MGNHPTTAIVVDAERQKLDTEKITVNGRDVI